MIFKMLLLAFLVTGALAEFQVGELQRQQLKDLLKQSCKKNGAEDKIEQVETDGKNFIDCIKGLIDVDQLKKEIEDAKPNGALDEVFKKYCDKAPQFKSCIRNLTTGITPCVDPPIREHLPAANNATDQLIDFVCYKDGDRIALFIAEGGPECFQEKANSIRECANKIKDDVSTVEAAKSLTKDQQCAKYDELTTCVVKALEECSTPTPANMAESLFRFVRNGSPCTKK